jgi:mRNA interferase MazF
MVDGKILVRGGIYLAKLNPAKTFEVGKVRPVIILNAQKILDISPPIVFVCPLSSKSHSNFASIHLKIAPRGNLEVESFALVEHCRGIGIARIIFPQIANLSEIELTDIISRLNNLLVS